ncbi:MAG: hypothetical protein WC777_00965 [Candidatus Gracilibacteria bacterium]
MINVKDAELYEELKEERLSALQSEMLDAFVVEEKWLTEGDFEDLFASWTEKYDDRIGDYSQCEEGSWSQIRETVEEFQETIDELQVDVKKRENLNFKDNFSLSTSDLEKEFENLRSTGDSALHGWEYYKNLVSLEKIEVDPAATVSDLTSSGDVFTFGSALDLLQEDIIRQEIEAQQAERKARYALLYGEGGAAAATDMQAILDALNQSIAASNTKDLPAILDRVAKIYDMQCN